MSCHGFDTALASRARPGGRLNVVRVNRSPGSRWRFGQKGGRHGLADVHHEAPSIGSRISMAAPITVTYRRIFALSRPGTPTSSACSNPKTAIAMRILPNGHLSGRDRLDGHRRRS